MHGVKDVALIGIRGTKALELVAPFFGCSEVGSVDGSTVISRVTLLACKSWGNLNKFVVGPPGFVRHM